jgi:tetratricopeptide (TPR) repeat protein
LELTLSEGIISSLRPVEGGKYLQITAPLSPGSSGGGLFDEEGRLIGLPSFQLSEGQQLNFAVPVEWITEFLNRCQETERVRHIPVVDWANHAKVLEENQDWAGLVKHSLLWTKAQPNEASAWVTLGIAYMNSEQTAKAIEAFEQALLMTPEDATTWYNLGVAYVNSNQPAKAISALDHALRLNPKYVNAWSVLGLAYTKSEQPAKAIEVLERALHITPEDATAWYYLGFAYGQSGQAQKEIECYQQALRIYPEYVDALFSLGMAYGLSGQKTKVTEVYKRLKPLSPARADGLFRYFILP